MSKIAIELGCSFIRMYVQDRDLFIKEPFITAKTFSKEGKALYGSDAKRKLAKVPGSAAAKSFSDSDVSEKTAALSDLISRCVYAGPKEKLYFSISCGNDCTEGEKRVISDALKDRFPLSETVFVPSVYAAAIGSGLLLEDGKYRMTAELTANGVNLTVLRGYSCFFNKFVKTGALHIDGAISKKLISSAGIRASQKDIEKIRRLLAFSESGRSKKLKLKGISVSTGLPKTAELEPGFFTEAVRPAADLIAEAISFNINVLPEAARKDVLLNGIGFVGGDLMPEGLCEYLSEKTGIEHIPVLDGENCIIYGLEKMISENLPLPDLNAGLSEKNGGRDSLGRELNRKHLKMAYDFDVEIMEDETVSEEIPSRKEDPSALTEEEGKKEASV